MGQLQVCKSMTLKNMLTHVLIKILITGREAFVKFIFQGH